MHIAGEIVLGLKVVGREKLANIRRTKSGSILNSCWTTFDTMTFTGTADRILEKAKKKTVDFAKF